MEENNPIVLEWTPGSECDKVYKSLSHEKKQEFYNFLLRLLYEETANERRRSKCKTR